MGQLDLFSLGPKPNSADKKEEKKPSKSAKTNDDADGIAKEQLAHEITLTQESIANTETPPELPTAEIEQNTVKEESYVFADERIRIKLKQVPKEEKTKEETVEVETEVIEAPALQEVKVRPFKIGQKRGRKSLKDIDTEADLIEVPEDEILFKKQYYAISEVAGWFKVNTSLLRFWETEFDVLKPRKNRKGDRMFRPEDVKNLQLIYHLLRDRKYTIDGAKEYIKGNKKKADTQLQLTQSLQKFKSFLLELKANLQ
jgi:DNA-binding transcriptional MerR regulator